MGKNINSPEQLLAVQHISKVRITRIQHRIGFYDGCSAGHITDVLKQVPSDAVLIDYDVHHSDTHNPIHIMLFEEERKDDE